MKVHISAASAAAASRTMTNYLTFSATAEICSLHASLPVFNVLEAQSAVNDGLETHEW